MNLSSGMSADKSADASADALCIIIQVIFVLVTLMWATFTQPTVVYFFGQKIPPICNCWCLAEKTPKKHYNLLTWIAGVFGTYCSLTTLPSNYWVPLFIQPATKETVKQGNYSLPYLYSIFPLNWSSLFTSRHSHCKQSGCTLHRKMHSSGVHTRSREDLPRKPRAWVSVYLHLK